MNRDELIKKITRAAKRDRKRRQDPRYLETMGFLVAKGFLGTNQNLLLFPNKRVTIADAIWAGVNVEPRILEVLPAAVLRLPRHFDLDATKYPELYAVVELLKRDEKTGAPVWGIAYEKFKAWLHLPLQDGRMKDFRQKKVTKTFRLKPEVARKLKEFATNQRCTETEALEQAVVHLGRR